MAPTTTEAPTTTTLPKDNAEVSISKSSLAPGETFQISGDGWMPDSTVDFEIRSDPVSLGSANVDGYGAFAAELQIPETVEAGSRTLVVSGIDADGNERTDSVPVTVTSETVDTDPVAQGSASTVAPAGSSGSDSGTLPPTGSSPFLPAFMGPILVAGALVLAGRRRATLRPMSAC